MSGKCRQVSARVVRRRIDVKTERFGCHAVDAARNAERQLSQRFDEIGGGKSKQSCA